MKWNEMKWNNNNKRKKRSQVATVKRSRVSDSEKIAGKRQKEIVYKYL